MKWPPHVVRSVRFALHPTETACWIWTGYYAAGLPRYRDTSARAELYRIKHGRKPARLQLQPRCGRRDCVNPNHMKEVG